MNVLTRSQRLRLFDLRKQRQRVLRGKKLLLTAEQASEWLEERKFANLTTPERVLLAAYTSRRNALVHLQRQIDFLIEKSQ